ncbi:hypothetical protein [Mycobacterium hubeiense]|uniref:hypothetical protein n=1 Tax=Mycobacterium hubeiense TaxID=1867256 RepID=UPI001E585CAE|nr:hypothetical protein [Mycobacterium sp. QGD 101]
MTLLAEPTPLPAETQPDPELSTHGSHRSPPTAAPAAAQQSTERAPWITFGCYFVALATMTVSLNTSWRFFDEVLHIPTAYGERYIMFAVAEMALVVAGAGMAVNVRRTGKPGPFRLVVWGMCAVSAYMAWKMSNFEEGLGRVILGPVLGTIMLHLALGLELRTHHHRTGTLARVASELRERLLSRLGLANDERDALQRTRDRAAFRAAQLSLPRRWRWSREARLQRALMAANVADDPYMREKMLARLTVLRHAHELTSYDQSSPWRQDHEHDATLTLATDDAGQGPTPDQLDAIAVEIKEAGETTQELPKVRHALELIYRDPRELSLREIGREVELKHEAVGRIKTAARRRLGETELEEPAAF